MEKYKGEKAKERKTERKHLKERIREAGFGQ